MKIEITDAKNKEFKPFTLTIEVESMAEASYLLAAFNPNVATIRQCVSYPFDSDDKDLRAMSDKLWFAIEERVKKYKDL